MSSVIYCDMYMNITPHNCVESFESCGSLHWSQDIAKEGKADTVEESAAAPARTSESCEGILFNPNVFTEFKLSGDPEVNIYPFTFLFVNLINVSI